LHTLKESSYDFIEVVVAPPSVYLEHVKKGLKQGEVSAQNCYHEKSGAYTGEVRLAFA
jgi:triosephosphate isomerase